MFKASRSSGDGKGRVILSLDGGGPRGSSQLKILLEIIHRMEYEKQQNMNQELDQMTRPCECFDMIGGSGTGGFIAILLVTFGLDVGTALEEFGKFSDKILSESVRSTPKERTETLRGMVGDLLKKNRFELDAKLNAPNVNDGGCKLVVPVMQANNLGVPVILRNHKVKDTLTPDITIMDAILSTCALPALFDAVNVPEGRWDHRYVSADQGLSNPTREVIKAAYQAFGEEEYVACLLSLGAGHLGVIRVSNEASAEDGAGAHGRNGPTSNEVAKRIAEDPERVAREMDEEIGTTGLYFRFSVDQGMQLSRPAAEKRESMKRIGAIEGSLGLIMTDTVTYLAQPKIVKDVDHCVDTISRKVGLETLYSLRRSGGANVIAQSLPPMVGHFVKREEPWKRMRSTFFCDRETIPSDRQIIMVISGMGGLGKTQLVLYFAREFRNMFSSIIFVDSSSVARLKADILRYVRSNPRYARASFERALEVLAEPLPENEPTHRHSLSLRPKRVPWLIIYDNCDDETLDLSSFLPRCDFGCIIITTRILSFRNLQPHNALELETMSSAEAVETLFFYSGRSRLYPAESAPSTAQEDTEVVKEIAETLGHLPLALVQVACYIQETGESWVRYRDHLKKNIAALMSKAPKSQRDGYKLSVFAAFYATFERIPPEAQRLLPLLSFFHSRDFPLEAIEIAAQDNFQKEYYDYQRPRLECYERGIAFLNECFCPGGTWDALAFNKAIATLRNYSFVSVSHAGNVRLLYMHPLIRSWTRTLLPDKESRLVRRQASVRILAASGHYESGLIEKHLVNYLLRTKLEWSAFHVNDKAAFAAILHRNGEFKEAMKIRSTVFLTAARHFRPGVLPEMLVYRKAATELAQSAQELGFYRFAISIYQRLNHYFYEASPILQPEALEDLNSLADVVSALNNKDALKECVKMMQRTLSSTEELGEDHPVTLATEEKLAMLLHRQGNHQEAAEWGVPVYSQRRRDLGDDHKLTIESCENVARIFTGLEKFTEAEGLINDVLARRYRRMGPDHRETIRAKSYLAKIYLQSERNDKARELYQEILNNRVRVLGPDHVEAAQAKMNLAWAAYYVGSWDEAYSLAHEGRDVIKEVLGKAHEAYSGADKLIKKIRRARPRYGHETTVPDPTERPPSPAGRSKVGLGLPPSNAWKALLTHD